ncbi:BTB/POZ domain-containing protein NPY2-like [Iris pallida]|uniref:BTB/POZ domain-containing protein NPY2-like n=1 Tax=Iris pallida TaxID=29817 RepID=A0AAX6E1H5_IRIPA|nr:BTB/POZ domain-containing protein NPY2-like [Iris pallida]
MSKSSRLQKLITIADDETHYQFYILTSLWCGCLQICTKLCYGMMVTRNAYNVIKAQCVAKYFDMDEAAEKDNLIYEIEV